MIYNLIVGNKIVRTGTYPDLIAYALNHCLAKYEKKHGDIERALRFSKGVYMEFNHKEGEK